VQSGYIGYYVHNLHFVAYSRAMQGRANDAIAASDLIAKEAAPAIESMSEMIDSFIAYPTFIRVRFGRWDEILAGSRPPDKLLASTAVWHWSRALAYTAKGDSAAASREADLFRAAKSRVPATWPWVNNKAAEMLALADIVLEARRSRNDAAATEHWRRAVDLQDRLVYDEPPPWYMPLRESLGGSLLRAGQANRAELVFREGLRRSPRNGRMLFGLMKSLEAQNKKEATDFVRQEFERSWKNADVKLRVEDL
jgi:hypothetical protein